MNITGTFLDRGEDLDRAEAKKNEIVRTIYSAMKCDDEFVDRLAEISGRGDSKALSKELSSVIKNEYCTNHMDFLLNIRLTAEYTDDMERDVFNFQRMDKMLKADEEIRKAAERLPLMGEALDDVKNGTIDLVRCYYEARFFNDFHRSIARSED
ncbi:MAG: hypothetical protein M1564_01075 [Candidatus Marsarchaeota archaeon]|jgi:hypothetical protein|nr:hypothetical protein [Candidatus Marsarchaeota archaeon]